MDNSSRIASIHVLDDNSLLHVFDLYRPFLLGEDEDDCARLKGGQRLWVHGRWWYRLAHVCQRWRNIIFRSSSYLDVSLVCTYGTPVPDMLAHSPPLPLVIDYCEGDRHITAEDEEGMILALKQHDRLRRIRLGMLITKLRKAIASMDKEYRILEHLIIIRQKKDRVSILTFPETLQAPHLRHLAMLDFTVPMGSRLLTNALGLVTLYLCMDHPSTYFHPSTLLHWLSLMPQLETLVIGFLFAVRNHGAERPLTHMPIVAPVALPNLRCIWYRGVSTYLEALVHQITVPRLEKIQVQFFNQLTFSVPHLLQFLNTTENLAFESVVIRFSRERAYVDVYPRKEGETFQTYALFIRVDSWHLDWQVSSVAQILKFPSQMFSAVENLVFEHEEHSLSSEEHNEVSRIEWRQILRSFSNVKALWIANGLVEELSRSLELGDGELPLELLPNLRELTFFQGGNTNGAFTSFIDARRNTGRPVNLVRHDPGPLIPV